jgi:hypothetical protein
MDECACKACREMRERAVEQEREEIVCGLEELAAGYRPAGQYDRESHTVERCADFVRARIKAGGDKKPDEPHVWITDPSWAVIWNGTTNGAAPEGTHWVRRGEAEEREERAREGTQEKVEKAAARERAAIIKELENDSSLLHDWARDGRNAAIQIIRARSLRLDEKIAKLAVGTLHGPDFLVTRMNEVIDAVNELVERNRKDDRCANLSRYRIDVRQ